MKPTELSDLSAAQATDTEMPAVAPPPRTHAGRSLSPKLECFAAPAAAQPLRPLMPGVANTPHIYALGRIEARFPDLAAEKEFAQASGRAESAGKTDLPGAPAMLGADHPGARNLPAAPA
jgi:hypothetical protein